MKIEFEDKSYVEVLKNNDEIILVISSVLYNKEVGNQFKKIINSVKLTREQYNKLISDI